MIDSPDSHTESIINRLTSQGNLLHVLGLLKCASNLHPDYSLTKTEFIMIIKKNYLVDNNTSHTTIQDLLNKIDEVWAKAERMLDDIGVLKEYSKDHIILYPRKHPFPDADYSSEKVRNRLMEIRKQIENTRDYINDMEKELPIQQIKLEQLMNECICLGHLPNFYDKTKCRICGGKI